LQIVHRELINRIAGKLLIFRHPKCFGYTRYNIALSFLIDFDGRDLFRELCLYPDILCTIRCSHVEAAII